MRGSMAERSRRARPRRPPPKGVFVCGALLPCELQAMSETPLSEIARRRGVPLKSEVLVFFLSAGVVETPQTMCSRKAVVSF